MRKMVFLNTLSNELLEKVKSAAPNWTIIHGKDQSVWLPHLKEAEIIGGWNQLIIDECLKTSSALRWIHAWSAGVDNLPLDLLREEEIYLTNSSGVHSFPISETIFAMMLAFTRRLHAYLRNQSIKKWHHSNNVFELHGKTMGILGVGAIGQETARLAKAFGMNVLGFRRSGETADYIDQMYNLDGLNDLIRQSDYLVNTLPLTQDTFHLIGEEQIEYMKSTAFYVNIGRGQTTDEAALIRALQENRIAGAGLDVFEKEPLPEDHPFWEMENVIITPHTAGSTENYNDRVIEIFLPNLQSYLNGSEPRINRIDLARQY